MVFVILGCFVVILIGFFNMNIEILYVFLVLIFVIFGFFVGLMIGLVGYVIKDFMIYGSVWWSWVICLGIIGCLYGWIGLKLNFFLGWFFRKLMVYFNIG